jgi:hypothetical protein
MSENLCGSCTLCCKVLSIEELGKVQGVWCEHCKPGTGCGAYATRPPSCQQFECLWLQTQKDPVAKFPPNLRPDRCHVVLVTLDEGQALVAHVDPAYPDAYQTGGLGHLVKSFRDRREGVIVVTGQKQKLLTVREKV